MGRTRDEAAETARIEAAIRTELQRGDARAAATLLLRRYADELLGYLVNLLGDHEHAREAFAMFARDLWLGLPKVQLHTSARAWAYALARNAAHRLLERVVRKQGRHEPLSQVELGALGVIESRPATPAHLKTENKTRLAALRQGLSLEDQEILSLRVDRGFDWREIGVALDPASRDLDVTAARYRKRFQLIKRKLAQQLSDAAGAADQKEA